MRNAEVQSKYWDYSWLWNIVPGSPRLWTPFSWGSLLCPVTPPKEHPKVLECWNEPTRPWEAPRIIPGSLRMVSPIPREGCAAQLSPGSGGRGRLSLASKSPWQSPAAAGGSSRPDGDIYISKKWHNTSELSFPALLGTASSWRGDIHLTLGQGINALEEEEEVRPFLCIWHSLRAQRTSPEDCCTSPKTRWNVSVTNHPQHWGWRIRKSEPRGISTCSN